MHLGFLPELFSGFRQKGAQDIVNEKLNSLTLCRNLSGEFAYDALEIWEGYKMVPEDYV